MWRIGNYIYKYKIYFLSFVTFLYSSFSLFTHYDSFLSRLILFFGLFISIASPILILLNYHTLASSLFSFSASILLLFLGLSEFSGVYILNMYSLFSLFIISTFMIYINTNNIRFCIINLLIYYSSTLISLLFLYYDMSFIINIDKSLLFSIILGTVFYIFSFIFLVYFNSVISYNIDSIGKISSSLSDANFINSVNNILLSKVNKDISYIVVCNFNIVSHSILDDVLRYHLVSDNSVINYSSFSCLGNDYVSNLNYILETIKDSPSYSEALLQTMPSSVTLSNVTFNITYLCVNENTIAILLNKVSSSNSNDIIDYELLYNLLCSHGTFKTFVEDHNSISRNLLQFNTIPDSSTFLRHLHSFKGLAYQLGFNIFGDTIHNIESSILNSDIDCIYTTYSNYYDTYVSKYVSIFSELGLLESSSVTLPIDIFDETCNTIVSLSPNSHISYMLKYFTYIPFTSITDSLPNYVDMLASKKGIPIPKLSVQVIDSLRVSYVYKKLFDDILPIVINNILDHGIEYKNIRIALGKSPHGNITVFTEIYNNSLYVSFADDGAGINYGGLYDKYSRGNNMDSSKDIKLLLLDGHDGITSKTSVSSTSGRGVGLSYIRDCVSRLNGILHLNSVRGWGTCLTVCLPSSDVMLNKNKVAL